MSAPPATEAASAPSHGPDWVSDSKIVQEAQSWARTFRAIINSPRQFAEAWAAGQRPEAMNPLTFFAISLALSTTVGPILRTAYGLEAAPLGSYQTLANYAVALYVTLFFHFVAFRKSGLPMRVTLGAVLFASGSFTVLGSLAISASTFLGAVLLGASVSRAREWLAIVTIPWSVFATALLVAGVHRRRTVVGIAWGFAAWVSFFLVLGLSIAAAMLLFDIDSLG